MVKVSERRCAGQGEVCSQAGFSYVEVMVAVAIISIMFLPLMAMMTSSMAAAGHGEYELGALELGQQVVELARDNPSGLDGWNDIDWNDPAESPVMVPDGYVLAVQVTDLVTQPLYQLQVTVSWQKYKDSDSVQLDTLIYKE